ncbi:MAG: hypothetical protein RLZZ148_1442 [Cyanobacteriota bacterium]
MLHQTKANRYKDLLSFQRLLLLVATLVKYPGVGYTEFEHGFPTDKHHDALEEVRKKLKEYAESLKIYFPEHYPSVPTLRKDLELLRDYGILESRMYRWGYYLGTGVMTMEQLKVAFNALESQANYQGDPRVRQICDDISYRLRGLEIEKEDFFYPVRQNLNRVIEYTHPEDMLERQNFRDTLYHQFHILESAIIEGQAVEISRHTDFYGDAPIGLQLIWPLQLIYHDIAWYLLYECCSNNHLIVGRVSRFKNYCQIHTLKGRGIEAQKHSLKNAHKLLKNGWGLKLGTLEEQKLELEGDLELISAKVRFFPPISDFIQEGECRHPKQKLKKGPKDNQTGKIRYVDYSIQLPPRSLDEFGIWVQRYADKAQILLPSELAQSHYQNALALIERYNLG